MPPAEIVSHTAGPSRPRSSMSTPWESGDRKVMFLTATIDDRFISQ